MQLFDAALFALHCHGMNAEQLGQLLPFDLSVGIQKGLRLPERVSQHIGQAVAAADQAGDGDVPRLCSSGASFSAERWMPGTTRPTKKSAFTSNTAAASCTASAS